MRIRFATLLGKCIAREREARGLTQTQLAERAGFSQPILSQWESGRHLPESVRFERLLVALGLDGVSLVARLVDAATNLDRTEIEAADLSHSRGRVVGDLRLLPAVKKDDGPPPPPPKRRRRPR